MREWYRISPEKKQKKCTKFSSRLSATSALSVVCSPAATSKVSRAYAHCFFPFFFLTFWTSSCAAGASSPPPALLLPPEIAHSLHLSNPIYIMSEINKQRILFFRTFCYLYETDVFKFQQETTFNIYHAGDLAETGIPWAWTTRRA